METTLFSVTVSLITISYFSSIYKITPNYWAIIKNCSVGMNVFQEKKHFIISIFQHHYTYFIPSVEGLYEEMWKNLALLMTIKSSLGAQQGWNYVLSTNLVYCFKEILCSAFNILKIVISLMHRNFTLHIGPKHIRWIIQWSLVRVLKVFLGVGETLSHNLIQ